MSVEILIEAIPKQLAGEVISPPSANFAFPSITKFVGDDVENLVSWSSPDSGPVASLTTDVPSLGTPTDLSAKTGFALWSKSNVQLADAGFIQVTIVDAIGSDVDQFELIVQAKPTISFANATREVTEGITITNQITWGDADASSSKPIASIEVTAGSGEIDQISDKSLTSGTARWINFNPQQGHAGQHEVTITDADGNTELATFDLTVNAANLDAPLISFSKDVVDIELPLGSTTFFDGNWSDLDASVSKPVKSIKIFDGTTDVTHLGFLNTGDLTSNQQQAWSWSSTTIDLTWDQKILTVEITDFDDLVHQDNVLVNLKMVDPLKQLQGHPIQKSTPWIHLPIFIDKGGCSIREEFKLTFENWSDVTADFDILGNQFKADFKFSQLNGTVLTFRDPVNLAAPSYQYCDYTVEGSAAYEVIPRSAHAASVIGHPEGTTVPMTFSTNPAFTFMDFNYGSFAWWEWNFQLRFTNGGYWNQIAPGPFPGCAPLPESGTRFVKSGSNNAGAGQVNFS